MYWKIVSPAKRNKCIYKESCSRYVFRIIKNKGWKSGLDAFIYRYKNCRSNYILTHTGKQTLLVTAENIVIQEKEIRESLIIR